MRFYLLFALLFFSSLAFCQEKKEEPKSEKESISKKKTIPPTPLSTRKFFVRYSPRYVSFQDTKQSDIQHSGFLLLSANLGKQWFTRRGNIFTMETRAATGSLKSDNHTSTFLGYSLNFSYLFDIKKYNGWDFYLGPEVVPGFYSKINFLLTNNEVYSSLESPFMVKLSGVKVIKKQVFRFDLGLSLFTLISETNSFAGNEYKAKIENKKIDYREPNSPLEIFDYIGFATINKYFKVYTNITYQLNSMLQFNYLWNYSSFTALSNYPTRYGEHNIGVAFFFGKMKKTN